MYSDSNGKKKWGDTPSVTLSHIIFWVGSLSVALSCGKTLRSVRLAHNNSVTPYR